MYYCGIVVGISNRQMGQQMSMIAGVQKLCGLWGCLPADVVFIITCLFFTMKITIVLHNAFHTQKACPNFEFGQLHPSLLNSQPHQPLCLV